MSVNESCDRRYSSSKIDISPATRTIMRPPRRWRNTIATAGILLSGVIAAAALFAPTLTQAIAPQSIRFDGGFLYIAPVPPVLGRFYQLSSDWMSRTTASRLRLLEDGKLLGPAHATHGDVRQRGSGRYVHWGAALWFSTSDGTDPRQNLKRYELQSKLSLKPFWAITGFASFAVAVVSLTLSLRRSGQHWIALARLHRIAVSFGSYSWVGVRRCAKWLIRSPILLMRGIGYLSLLAAGFYMLAILYALLTGWGQPTAAPLQWTMLTLRAAELEPLVHLLLLSVAILGAAASWFNLIVFRGTLALRRDELLLGRFLRRWGIWLAIALSVFSVSAMWAGIPRAGDLNWGSIMGLIPFSDANGYLAATHDQAKDGSWSAFVLRRPLAAAFRSSLMFVGGYWYANAVLLQVILIASAAYVAARAVAGWRGIYAGVAFFALSYVTARNFLPTFLTEPLALFWALLAIPFLVASLRDGSLKNGLLGLAMLTVALFMRPGAMFLVPAVGLWLIWRFGRTLRERIFNAAYVAVVVLSVAAASHVLQKAYGVGSDLTGSNFSYVLCGLSIGSDWSSCPERYVEVRTLGSEKRVTDFLYQKALENIAAQPEVMIQRLYLSGSLFTKELPAVLWRGYSWWGSDYLNLRLLFLAFTAVGLLYVGTCRREKDELAFWLLAWAGIIASGAFVHFDDGRRVMVVGYPLLWMFLASGLTTVSAPKSRVRASSRLSTYGLVGLLCAAVLFFVIPWLANQISPATSLRRNAVMPSTSSEHIVFGGKRITGMLVVADDQPLRSDIPTLRFSRFAEFIKLSNVEFYQGLIQPQTPDTPFGFIWSPRLEQGVESYFQYIVPAEVMQRPDVKAWKFQVREWNRKQPYGPYWFFVDNAEALR